MLSRLYIRSTSDLRFIMSGASFPGLIGRHRIALALFCGAIWLPGLPARILWPTDEPRYALIAREMVERGDYVVPVKRGEVYHSQPPLFLWATALSSRLLGGSSEAAYRAPSFLAALAGVLTVHALAASWFGPAAGLLSGMVLATDLRYLLQAQWVSTDMLLCLFVTASLACFAHGYRSARRGWYLACYALASAATMTKGPVGFVLPALVILSFLVVRRDLAEILRMRLPTGALLFAVIVLPWYLLFWQRAGADEAVNLVLTQSVRRYVAAWNNQQPWYYFLWRLPADLLPWTPLLPFAVWFSRRRMPALERHLLLCWLAAMLVFFSISTGKRGVYLLPLHPAAAILMAWFCDDALRRGGEDPRSARSLRLCALLMALLFAGAGAAALSTPSSWLAAAPGALPAATMLGWMAVAVGAVIALAPLRLVPHVTASATGLLALTALALAAPIQDQRLNTPRFAAGVARHVPEGARLGIVQGRFEDIVFYSRRHAEIELRPGRRLERWMAQPDPVYAVLDSRAYNSLASGPAPSWELLTQGDLAGEAYFLIRSP